VEMREVVNLLSAKTCEFQIAGSTLTVQYDRSRKETEASARSPLSLTVSSSARALSCKRPTPLVAERSEELAYRQCLLSSAICVSVAVQQSAPVLLLLLLTASVV
jgi:hypothetical protein